MTNIPSAVVKLMRAREHINALVDEVTGFREQQTYRFVREDNSDDPSDPLVRVHWRIHVVKPVPEYWGAIIGDVLTNLRAALDHAVFHIASKSGDLTPSMQRRMAFPIFDDATEFARQTRQTIGVLPVEVQAVIEDLQPFRDQSDLGRDHLAVLRTLCNIDKHRTLAVVDRSMISVDLQLDPSLSVVEQVTFPGRLHDRAVIARVKFRRPPGPAHVDMKPEFSHIEAIYAPELPEFYPLGLTLELMYQDVWYAVARLIGADYLPPLPDFSED